LVVFVLADYGVCGVANLHGCVSGGYVLPDFAPGRRTNGDTAVTDEIKKLQEYFDSLTTLRKKEFIKNLQIKMSGMGQAAAKYKMFLAGCIKEYNAEVRIAKEKYAVSKANQNSSEANENTPPLPEGIAPPGITSEAFNTAMTAMLSALKTQASPLEFAMSKLTGTWERVFLGKTFYYKFNPDGTFTTNEVKGHKVFSGSFVPTEDDILVMEPHDVLQVSDITLSLSGRSLIITYEDGIAHEYEKKG